MKNNAELVIVLPEGKSREFIKEFMGRCICYGLDFYFEKDDTLPASLPDNIDGVRAIIIDREDFHKNQDTLAKYEQAGARVYVFQSGDKAVVPAVPNTWATHSRLEALVVDANLTVESSGFRAKMASRSDDFLFDKMAERMLQTNDLRWYDATRYNWESLVDAYEITGKTHFLETVHSQIRQAMKEQENDCANCDRISGLLPGFRIYEITGDEDIIKYAIEKVELYLKITPKHKKCFTNFTEYPNTVRSEIIFHVCPVLQNLSRLTGNSKYSEIAVDQFEHINQILQCSKTGLYYHGAGDGGPTAAFWARGTAFAFLGVLALLEKTEPDAKHYDILSQTYLKMAETIKQFQDNSGFWFSRLDLLDSEKDSSGTAWNTACFYRGIRLGFLDDSYLQIADSGWDAVKSRIWRGGYPGTTMATTVSKRPSYYAKTPLNTIGWTHFAFRALCEQKKYQTKNNNEQMHNIKSLSGSISTQRGD